MLCRCLLFAVLVSACDASLDVAEKSSELSGATTIVSLTFDDTLANQYQVADLVEARGMRAVFYINSPRLGTPGYLTFAQAMDLQTRGHEIGGHTLGHVRLTTLGEDEMRDQICNDRANLLEDGFAVTTFAYPFGADDATVREIADECGYNYARDVGGLRSTTCTSCPLANPIPPANAMMVRTYDSVESDTTLAQMQQQVLNAEANGGGYVPMVFHNVCNGCASNAVSPALLAQFLDWLAARGPATQVGTMQEALGGGVQPPVRFPDTGVSVNLAKNPSLETDADGNQVPDCWQRGGFGTNSATYTLVSDASDGARAQRIDVTSLSSGGRRLVTAQDSGTCAPAITPGHTYRLSAFYKATTQPRITVYYRNAAGSWVWFAETPLLPTSSTYREATLTTPAIPAGATHLSFGVGIFAVGTVTIDQHAMFDTAGTPAGDTVVPLLSTACNGNTCTTQPYTAPVRISFAASDAGSGIDEIRYTTNGSDPTNGTLYTGEFTLSSTATVRVTAIDNEGNRTFRTTRVTINVPDTTPPSLAIACNGAACATSPYAGPVTVTLTASDAGSGVREIRYTTNGSDPTNGTLYTGPFTVSSSATVRSTAVDNANNRTSLSTSISIVAPDTTPPSLAIACNGAACSTAPYTGPVIVTLTASDAGSGIREVRYTINGSDPTNGTLYTGPFTVSSSATVRSTAVDNADNRTSLATQITIGTGPDTTPPALSIACNGTTCSAAPYSGPVTVTLTASDASGVAEVRYTLDGSDPIAGTLYAGPFNVTATATVRATAVDTANNRTSITQLVTIEAAPANLLQNASLETDANGDQIPDCWKRDGYGTNTAVFTLVSDAFDGVRAQKLDITAFTSGGRRLASAQDSGACAPVAVPGRRYTMTGYYKSTIQPRFSVYYRNASGSWSWLAESAPLPTSSTYRQATFTSPPLPAGATHISVGLSIFGVGSITTDMFTLVEAP